MDKSKKLSLKKAFVRLTIPICITACLLLSVIPPASSLYVRKHILNSFRPLAEEFVNRNHNAIRQQDSQQLRGPLKNLMVMPELLEAAILNPQGRKLAECIAFRPHPPTKSWFLFLSSPLIIENPIVTDTGSIGTMRLVVNASAEVADLKHFTLLLLAIFGVFSLFLFLFLYHYNRKMSRELRLIEDSIHQIREVETLQTVEFKIEELAAFQRQMKNDSKAKRILKEELKKQENLALIGNFASSIVHDIRNPISAIEGFTTLIKMKFCENSDEMVEYTDRILATTALISRLLSDVLTFVRDQKVDLKLMEYPSAGVVQNAVQFFQNQKVSVIGDTSGDSPVHCDIDRLSRAVMNLIKNAVEISKPGDTVTVKSYRSDAAVIFSVKDTGPGIPQSIQDSLFEPFTTANKRKGTGLGLFIAKSIVEAHKGVISFETGPQGTEFLIRLPQP